MLVIHTFKRSLQNASLWRPRRIHLASSVSHFQHFTSHSFFFLPFMYLPYKMLAYRDLDGLTWLPRWVTFTFPPFLPSSLLHVLPSFSSLTSFLLSHHFVSPFVVTTLFTPFIPLIFLLSTICLSNHCCLPWWVNDHIKWLANACKTSKWKEISSSSFLSKPPALEHCAQRDVFICDTFVLCFHP